MGNHRICLVGHGDGTAVGCRVWHGVTGYGMGCRADGACPLLALAQQCSPGCTPLHWHDEASQGQPWEPESDGAVGSQSPPG